MANLDAKRIVDLSHLIEAEMTTYKGLPGPHICDYWTRAGSADHYDDGSSFQIGRIDMVANTGTYLDAPGAGDQQRRAGKGEEAAHAVPRARCLST